MIVTAAQLTMLRKGAVQVIEIPAGQPAPGAAKPKAPVTIGKAYGVQLAPFTRSKLSIVVHAIELTDHTWRVTVKAGATELPRFLTARPGKRGDYTPDERYAMKDEPEVIPEQWDARVARVANQIAADPPVDRGRAQRHRHRAA